jgi:hypothetical protein
LLDVIIDWVLPFVIKQINKDHTLTASYSPAELRLIDQAITDLHADAKVKGIIFSPDFMKPETPVPSPLDMQMFRDQKQAELNKDGNKRTLFIPEDFITMEKIEQKVRFDITDEMMDDQRRLNALAGALAQLAPEDPQRAPIIQEMMEVSGISSASFPVAAAAPTAPAPRPARATRVQSVLPQGQQV